MNVSPRWTIAVFASRESSDTLQKTVTAAVAACGDVPSTVEVLVNGNFALANALTDYVKTFDGKPASCTLRLWFIAGADKAHAWNQFLYQIVQASKLIFFIDGYVRLQPDALRLLDRGLEENPDALAGTGVPSIGRTASTLRKTMLATGGVHGNLYSIRHSVLEQLKKSGFKLPVGLYRNDPLLGAIFNYNLDPAQFKWTPSRVFVHPTATWDLSNDKPSVMNQISTTWKRRIRQSQGALESVALRDHLSLQRRPPHELSESVLPMISSWVSRNRLQAWKMFFRRPTTFYAYYKLRKSKSLSGLDIAPELVATCAANPVPDFDSSSAISRESATVTV